MPDAVIGEVKAGLDNDSSGSTTLLWSAQYRLADIPVPGSVAVWGLGAGESQVITQCLGQSYTAVLDDLAARRCAKVHGIGLIGTLGVILAVKRAGVIAEARSVVDDAIAAGLYLDDQLARDALASVGE